MNAAARRPATVLVRAALLALALAASLAACDTASDTPTAEELNGTWVNVDGTTIRAFEFVGTTRTYTLYLYEQGAAPAVNQTGTYSVDGSRLITSVDSAVDASIVGQAFANAIKGFTGSTLTLSSTSAASGQRVFTKATALP